MFFNLENLCFSPTLVSNPRRSAEVKMCEGCRMPNFGELGGKGESGPLEPPQISPRFHLLST